MTLPLPDGSVVPKRGTSTRGQLDEHRKAFESVQRNLDEIAMQFPVQSGNLANGVLTDSLPSGPTNGAQVLYSPAVGVIWSLVFDKSAHDQDGYGWVVVGGQPLYDEVAADEATSSTSYTSLSTAGPSVTLPRAGVWDLAGDAQIRFDGSTAQWVALVAPKIGSAAALDANRLQLSGGVQSTGGRSPYGFGGRTIRRACGAVTVAMQYRVTSAVSVSFGYRVLTAMPRRLES